MTRQHDLVIFGATGFTGRLVAEYVKARGAAVRWAIAGRNRDKLEALGLGVPVLIADAHDRAALDAIARASRVVCTTVGPFSKYGSDLVAACAEHGTHYCDLTAEVHWMREMIDLHHERARATGARIVHACGFDSIPSDLGTFLAQQEMVKRFGAPARSITALYGEQSGGMSGGTVASGLEIAKAAEDLATRRAIGRPHALDPDPDAVHDPVRDEAKLGWEPRLRMFTIPFFMAFSNTRVVRRGHALAGFPWGQDFRYREVMSMPGNARGLAMAVGVTAGLAGFAAVMKRPALRERLAKRLPQPGEGPSPEKRAKGHWKVRFLADEKLVYIAADAHGDPGYASTAKMLGESALCLARDPLTSPGGVLTPAFAMGNALAERLRGAGLTFAPED